MTARLSAALCCAALGAAPAAAQEAEPPSGAALALLQPNSALGAALAFLQPTATAPIQALHLRGTFGETRGATAFLQGGQFDLRLEPPRHLRLEVSLPDLTFSLGQNQQQLWIHLPTKNLLILGDPDVPRFSTRPDSVSSLALNLLRLPLSRVQLALLPTLLNSTTSATPAGGRSFTLSPSPAAAALDLPVRQPLLTATIPPNQAWPNLIRYQDDANAATLHLAEATFSPPLPDATWQPSPDAADHVEKVSLSHLDRFLKVTLASLGRTIPTLPPATGQRHLLRSSGAGRLEDHDGTRVLFLAGSPQEMGRQHGTLLKKEVRQLVDRILYGIGVGSSFDKGRWFFGEIEEAVRRSAPFIDPRHLAEMDALAAAAGVEPEEIRLANFFPELFHCSGFALLGQATQGGKLYHGRVLDYLRGVGLEEHATVIVYRPDQGHAWVNISYAAFTGSVTAMNDQQLCLGEMGGRGEGAWDGKPMAQLVREVMERSSTLDEALDFMRRTPRTCEYYYVLSDAKSHRAVGIKATPTTFEVVATGQAHPELPNPIPDTVLLSAGTRYQELTQRVHRNFGHFDAPAAIQLMSRPVCMTSNIHSVLFAPDTLDFWVANADSQHVASETRFTAYNLKALLQDPPAPPRPRRP